MTTASRLPLLLGALAFTGVLSAAPIAEANHGGGHGGGGVHFSGGAHFGGSVHVGGGHVNMHWSAGARGRFYGGYGYRGYGYRGWGVGGHVWVGGYGYYPRPYYYYPVPSYYGTTYYPVAPAATVAAAAVLAPPPDMGHIGIGLFAGGVNGPDGTSESSDVGLLGRLRLTPGLIVEGELGKTSYENNLRVDRRLGASLIYEFGAQNRFAPYILAGAGVQQANVNGDYSTTQDYGEIGVGVRFAITPHFHLTADIRAGSRNTVASDDMATLSGNSAARTIAPPPTSAPDTSEDYTRGRLAAILYF